MDVVLPLPLGPGARRFHPPEPAKGRSPTTCLSPKCLFNPVTSMANVPLMLRGESNVHRQSWAKQHGFASATGTASTPEHKLLPGTATVDDGWCVFGLRGNEINLRPNGRCTAIASGFNSITLLDHSQTTFGNEEPQASPCISEEARYGRTCGDPFAGAGKVSFDDLSHSGEETDFRSTTHRFCAACATTAFKSASAPLTSD